MELSALIESTDILHDFLFQRYRHGTSSAATLLVENINWISLLETEAKAAVLFFQEFKRMKVKLKDRSGWLAP